MSGLHQKWEMPGYFCKLNPSDFMAGHGILKLSLVREVGKFPAMYGVSTCLQYFYCHLSLELKLEGEVRTCAKPCARTVQHIGAESMGFVWCWDCVMLQCTKLNLIQGEKGYTLYSRSSPNVLLRRTIIRTQHLVEGETQLLFFSSLSKTAALILFWRHF